MHCMQACTSCTQYRQQRHQAQIKIGPAGHDAWQEAAVVYKWPEQNITNQERCCPKIPTTISTPQTYVVKQVNAQQI